MRRILLTLMLVPFIAALGIVQALPKQTAYLQSPPGQKLYLMLEIADEEEEQKMGLMYRGELEEGGGMLFIWPEKKMISMWMKNTFIPLDMLFIEDGVVRHIIENTKPKSLDIISSKVPVDMVLEVPAGYVKKYGIKPNWQLHVVPNQHEEAR